MRSNNRSGASSRTLSSQPGVKKWSCVGQHSSGCLHSARSRRDRRPARRTCPGPDGIAGLDRSWGRIVPILSFQRRGCLSRWEIIPRVRTRVAFTGSPCGCTTFCRRSWQYPFCKVEPGASLVGRHWRTWSCRADSTQGTGTRKTPGQGRMRHPASISIDWR